jgi:hypothetical protein
MPSEWLLKFRSLSARSDVSERPANSVDSADSSTTLCDARDRSTLQRANGPKNTIGTQHSENPEGHGSGNAEVELPAAAALSGETSDGETTSGGQRTDPADWRGLYEERAAIRQYYGHCSRAEAEALAWAEVQSCWQMERGERVSRHFCAGCRRPIGTEKVLDLIDGNRVHTSDDHACLTRHGERWRAAATRALVAFGLQPPSAP